jgi:signal transduction histidine kinase
MKELDKYKDILMAKVSHELKTPINSLNAYLQKAHELNQNPAC